ncbi:MAG: hypothetical protein ACLSA6_06180 [Holdemania massiliensis]
MKRISRIILILGLLFSGCTAKVEPENSYQLKRFRWLRLLAFAGPVE